MRRQNVILIKPILRYFKRDAGCGKIRSRLGYVGGVGGVESRGPDQQCFDVSAIDAFTITCAVQLSEEQMKHPFLFCSLLAIAACAQQLSPPPVATAPPPVQPGPPLTRPNTFIVFFPWNGRSVSPTGREILQQAVAAYRTGAPVTVLVTGYTDGSGSYRYNQRLSARRVWHVTAMLMRMGVSRNALVVSGRGENDNRLPTTNGVREPQNRVKVVEDFVMSAAFSPDGLRHTARVRDAATGREIAVLRGHEGLVWSAAFSPDGSRIVTTSWDNTDLGRRDGEGDRRVARARGPCVVRRLQPRRVAHRHDVMGQHGADLGRRDGEGDRGAARARQSCAVRRVQP